MVVDTQELVSIDIKTAKPSDICASQPKDRWCRYALEWTRGNEPSMYCRVGWLGLIGRVPRHNGLSRHQAVARAWGIPMEVLEKVAKENDLADDGYEESLRVLREAGY